MKGVKRFGVGLIAAFVLGLLMLIPATTQRATATQEVTADDAAAFYKAKCTMCHGAKAEKKFNAELTDEQMVEAVLKGKKAEKPPHMPEYGSKGVTAEQAKGLVDFMKKLKAGS